MLLHNVLISLCKHFASTWCAVDILCGESWNVLFFQLCNFSILLWRSDLLSECYFCLKKHIFENIFQECNKEPCNCEGIKGALGAIGPNGVPGQEGAPGDTGYDGTCIPCIICNDFFSRCTFSNGCKAFHVFKWEDIMKTWTPSFSSLITLLPHW